ncbi:MAG: hypothetical protein F8N38_15475 [Hungatella sp.]|nr:hypothetical protein [Hungatella sp.]
MSKVFGNQINNFLLKVCEKEEYAKDLKAGKLYMKESGYFRKLEDNYRGDYNDGKIPIKSDLVKYNKLDNSSERFSEVFPGVKVVLQAGFQGDDKIPIFCSTLFNEKILQGVYKKGEHKVYQFKSSYINEMRRFGKYMVVFRLDELISKLKDENAIGDVVSYWKIEELYGLRNINTSHNYRQFFNKDIAYQNQNEYRILIPDSKLIEKNKDFHILSVGELVTARIFETMNIEGIEF